MGLLLATVATIFSISVLSLSGGLAEATRVADVTAYGAVGDGEANDSEAFLKAWAAMCGSPGDATIQIPNGKTFLLQSVTFQGPCKPNTIHLQVLGRVTAPKTQWGNCKEDSMLTFSHVDGLVVDGNGVIDAQGSIWWQNINDQSSCVRPTTLRFKGCDNLKISGLSLLNSAKNHISINTCHGVAVSNLRIIAPENSPNTDGIDISSSSQVHVFDCVIATGDDCVAINDGSTDINIVRVACGPGHGISIGSLGAHGGEGTVEGVYVGNCTFARTQNGARIKTWAGGSGYARKITFDKIKLVGAKNPIIIDQHYTNQASDVEVSSDAEVSDVTFSRFQGTSSSPEAISLLCAAATSCTNIKMSQIKINPAVSGMQLRAVCQNAHGTSSSTIPSVTCLNGKTTIA